MTRKFCLLHRLSCYRCYHVLAHSLGCHHSSACQPNSQLPAPLSQPNGFLWFLDPALSIHRSCQKGWGINAPLPGGSDECCQINAPTPLFSRCKNPEACFLWTHRELLSRIKLQLPSVGMCLIKQCLLCFFPSWSYFPSPLPVLSGITFQINDLY